MYIQENNALDIYEEYFDGAYICEQEEAHFKTLSVYRDCCSLTRKVTDLSWSLDGIKIAGAYSVDEYIDSTKFCFDCYIWDIENCNVPYCALKSKNSLNIVEFSPRDLDLIVGGCNNGQIGLWDTRTGGQPYYTTDSKLRHEEDVTDIKWIYSKNGLEFYSASNDGRLYCWDTRFMDSPSLILNLHEQTNCCNSCTRITCLEYDTCLPHKFMMGTVEGIVLSCNRQSKVPTELITDMYLTNNGPVQSVQRNTNFSKIFASCTTWGVKIWAEDLPIAPLLNLVPKTGYVTDAAWCTSHSSFLLTTKTTGHIELWDILLTLKSPLLSFKVATEGVSRLKSRQNSDQVACGTPNGCIFLLEVPEYSKFPSKPERTLFAAMIDREWKRERLIEGMNKERRLREKNNNIETEQDDNPCILNIKPPDDINNVYELEINEDEIEEEFRSDWNAYLYDTDEMEEKESEKPFVDPQIEDALKSISKTSFK